MAQISIQVDVYRYSNPALKVETLNARIAPSFLEEIKGDGGGNVSVSIYDPKIIADPTLVDHRNVLKFRIGPNIVGGMLIQKKSSDIIDDSADREVTVVSGVSLRGWFADAAVYPDAGLTKSSFDQRAFNFAAVAHGTWYSRFTWTTPVNVAQYLASGNSWGTAPAEWPDYPLANWVWASSSASQPAGDVFFRYEFSVAAKNKYSLFLAADDQFSVYIDGQLNTQSDPDTSAYSGTERVDFTLDVGNHVVGIRVTNKTASSTAGLIAALAYFGDPLIPTKATTVTYTGKVGDTGWKMCAYPTVPPGFTPGEIMLTLMSEATARGVLFPSYLTPTFTAANDTYGNAWDSSLDWAFDTGASLLDVVGQLEELVCDLWIDASNMTINMAIERGVDRSIYRYAVDGITVNASPIIFRPGVNLGAANIDSVSEIVNTLVVQGSDGWLEIPNPDTSSVSTYGRIEGSMQTGASDAISNAVADVVFEQKSDPEEGAAYVIIPIAGSIPWVDFFPGDWVLAPNALKVPTRRRVMSIAVEEDAARNPQYTVEFDTIFQDTDDKLSTWLKKLGGGSLGGQFANGGSGASLPGTPVITAPPLPVIKLPVAPTGLSSSSVGLWSLDGVTAYSEVTLSWSAVTSNTDGTPTVPYLYEVWGKLSADPSASYQLQGTTSATSLVVRPYVPGSVWNFQVRAFNSAAAPSAFSSTDSETMVGPTTAMPAPTTPTVTSDKGVLIVGWDGLLTGTPPAAPPNQFRYIYATVATSSGGTYARVGATFGRDGRTLYISGLAVGTAYWVKLVAVDGAGIASTPSAFATTTITGVDLGDLDTTVTDAINAANAAARAAYGTDNLLFGPGFEENDVTIWSEQTVDVDNVTTTPRTGLRALSLKGNATPYIASRYGAQLISVDDLDSFYFSAYIRALGASATTVDGVSLGVEYGVDATHVTSYADVATSPSGVATTYVNMGGVWNAPAGTRFMRPVIKVYDTNTSHSYLMDDIVVRRQIPNALIVDGAIDAGSLAAGSVTAAAIAAGSVAAASIQALAITGDKIAANTITAAKLAAGTITANEIAAGTITVTNLNSAVGASLNISSNSSVNILTSAVSTVSAAQSGTASTLATMATYYSFGPGGAVISSPSSPFAIHIANDRIEILQLSVPVSYWNAGQMFVKSFVGEEVSLGNHKIEKYGTGTVVRAL